MHDQRISMSPGPNMFYVLHRKKCSWKTAISELIDNSLDWNANDIKLIWSSKGGRYSFAIKDNGCGCDDLKKMVCYAEKTYGNDNRIGRYGVGLKDVAYWLWGLMRIASHKNGSIASAMIEWETAAKKRTFEECELEPIWMPSSAYRRADVHEEHGTTIAFNDIKRRPPTTLELKQLSDHLSFQYSPALKAGKTITLTLNNQTTCVSPFVFPKLIHKMVNTITIDNRRSYKISAGVVPDGCSNKYNGFSVAYKNRVLFTNSVAARGKPTSNFFAYVALRGDWDLGAHKDELNAGDDDLYLSLANECRDLLDKAQSQSTTIHLNGVSQAVSDKLGVMLESLTGKEKRPGPTRVRGTVKPTGTRGPRIRANNVNTNVNGPVAPKVPRFNPAKGITLNWWTPGDSKLIGKADLESNTINLNADHPYIAAARDSGDTDILACLCATILAQYIASEDDDSNIKQKYFHFIESEEFRDASMILIAEFTRELKKLSEPSLV